MHQLQQNFDSGELELVDVPEPRFSSNGVLVDTRYSLVSAGTEQMLIDLAKKSLLGKVKERPDLVKQVVEKARKDGLKSTYRSVRSRLDKPLPLGYSCSGRVIDVGEDITDLSVGDLVACGGAGYATHAEVNHVPENLCVHVPDSVELRDASFTTVGAIALQGIRRLDPTPGEKIAVIGLGLVGRLTTKLLSAYGHPVLGIDIDPSKVEEATELTTGAVIGEDDVEQAAEAFSGGSGVDGVIITAATDSDQPVEMAGDITREGGRVSVVGDVGMDIPREQYYDKELDFRLSRSYGPGRYDRAYEEKGYEYPIGYVRWTEKRNMAEFVRLLNAGKISLEDLVSHTFPFDDALEAYDLILEGGDYTGVVLEYDQKEENRSQRIELESVSKRSVSGRLSVGMIGAGSFATSTLLPTILKIDDLDITAVASATGVSGKTVGEKYGAEYVTTDYEEIIEDESIDLVVVATRHNLHAEIAVKALEARKDVHLEKPPVLDREELQAVVAAEQASDGRLMVGYNRRFSEPAREIKEQLSGRDSPFMAQYRINAGAVPSDHWTIDPEEGGGRIVGEVCHFVDLLQFFSGSDPERVYATGPAVPEDSPTRQNVQAIIEFGDGSTGTITYTTLGDDSGGKESLEVFHGGETFRIDDFKTGRLGLSQSKGFETEFRKLVDAIHNDKGAPIQIWEIVGTSLATFAVENTMTSNTPIIINGEFGNEIEKY
ncbi:bi-domain-containing oxidoreductase [Natronomonas gomsonensis]|uniref:bi-domain-containing oxidoreductase n=1 Tax=Natronomonas gomsonensis TaxID=1046043 RepID=UPI00227ABDB6|nr:bi-domain-containing oxidoreductase [Natronomonas gomsonensis]MCY4732137.1 bi-domain-containing oxidoreductase [Natronomonas gomsonensis]